MMHRFHIAPRLRRAARAIALYPRHACAAIALLCVLAGSASFYANHTPQTVQAAAAMLATPTAALNDQQRLLATTIFRAQERGDFDWADQLMAQMDNQILLGHMLAQRYLGVHYTATADELVVWLANFADHPQAGTIRAMAQRKGATAQALAGIEMRRTAPLKGDGYIEHLGRTAMPDAFYHGLARWKEKDYKNALAAFADAAVRDDATSPWQQSAAHYWAYRAAHALGRDTESTRHLARAGAFPLTFYGQLANQQLDHHRALIAAAPYVPDHMREHPAVLRARALVAANQNALAEEELRHVVMTLDADARPAILSIAGELGLANLQVRLASLRGLSAQEKIYGSYPMPPWFTDAQAHVDSSLLLAIARQESVFRPDVQSHMGATGMMQMLPSTARHVERTLSAQSIALASNNSELPLSQQLGDAQVNIRLGAEYVRLLARQPMVRGDLIRLIAAYNAGPGSVQNWQAAARHISDPLLYIESIPYGETRNYVMQVLAHQWVYQTLSGQPVPSRVVLARGQWPLFTPATS